MAIRWYRFITVMMATVALLACSCRASLEDKEADVVISAEDIMKGTGKASELGDLDGLQNVVGKALRERQMSGLIPEKEDTTDFEEPFQVKFYVQVNPCMDSPPDVIYNVSKGSFSNCESSKHGCDKSPRVPHFCPKTCGACIEEQSQTFTLQVYPHWAPKAAAAFREMVENQWLDGARFYEVKPKHSVYFGIPAHSGISQVMKKMKVPTEKKRVQDNTYGTVAMNAWEQTYQQQDRIVINLKKHLFPGDSQKHGLWDNTPFAEVTSEKGMEVIRKLFWLAPDDDDLDKAQEKAINSEHYKEFGDEYIRDQFPKLSVIRTAKILKRKAVAEKVDRPIDEL